MRRDLPITRAIMLGTNAPRALVVDDAPENRMLVSALLSRQGFDVAHAEDAEAAVAAASSDSLELIVVDLGLGVELCRRVRECSDAHVLMLTERDAVAGDGDYVTKPFSVAELAGRVQAVLRRDRRRKTTTARGTLRAVGTLTVDVAAREAKLDGAVLVLTRIEFDLLDTLTAEPGVALSRAQLLERVWGANRLGDDHLVDVQIANLRRKLADDPGSPDFIRTVRGIGYRLGAGR